MTSINFDGRNLSLGRVGFSLSAELKDWEAKWLRNRLLEKYPLETDTTATEGPLREVTLEEARPGDIATFTNSVSGRKYVCTLKTDDGDLLADKWLTANVMSFVWTIRTRAGRQADCMRDLHIWRWDGAEEPDDTEEPKGEGVYLTKDGKTTLLNDGSDLIPWRRILPKDGWDDCMWKDWDEVVDLLGPDAFPLKRVTP